MQKSYFINLLKEHRSFIFTLYLSFFFLWIGLGVGSNLSDTTFWINSTWQTIKLEWLFMFIYSVLNKKISFFPLLWKEHRFITIIGLLWVTSVLLSYLLSPLYSWQNPLALMRLIETFSHVLFFLFLWDFFSNYNVNYKILFAAIILPSLIVMGYFIYIHFAYPGLEADRHVFSMRSAKLVLNTHLHRIGYQIEAAIAFSIAFLFFKRYKYVALLIIMLFFIFLLWLGGRAAFLGIAITLISLLFYFRQKISGKIIMSLGLVVMAVVVLTFSFDILNPEYFIHAINKTLQVRSLDHLLTGRIEVWGLVLEELQGHWLFGTGPQSYLFYFGRHQDVIHAHNFIIQFLGEWGIVGTLLFLIMLFSAIQKGINMHLIKKPQEQEAFVLSAGILIIAFSLTGLFGGIYYFSQSIVYLCLSFALWVTPLSSKSVH